MKQPRLTLCGLVVAAGLSLVPVVASAKPTGGLVLAAQVWGLVKYHAPDVTACKKDWDQVLLDEFAGLETAASGSAADETTALNTMVDAAGTVGTAALDDTTPAWIREADIGNALMQKLAWLALQRPDKQCYVSLLDVNYVRLNFSVDAGHDVTGLPDRAHRGLAAFRFWNVIRYFYPYKKGMGRDWPDVLHQWLPIVLDASSYEAYVRAMRGFTAAIKDGHDYLRYPYVQGVDLRAPPFLVRRIHGKPVVAAVLPAADALHPGDVVLEVDGTSIADRVAQANTLSWGANPAWRDETTLKLAVSGETTTGSYQLRRPDGSTYKVDLPRSFAYGAEFPSPYAPLEGIPTAWKIRTLPGGCTMGIANLWRLQPDQVDKFAQAMAKVDAIVMDVRNYPANTLFPLANALFPQPRPIAHFKLADLHHPGSFLDVPLAYYGGYGKALLAGKPLLILIDDRAISHSEYTVMDLQASGNAIVFGSQAAGSDGDVIHPPLHLPGQLTISFTGDGVYYPDGTPTQRIGMVPDVQVTPTIAGLAAGKDEVLDAALNCEWVHARPLRRMPVSGLYSDAKRQGESVDVHYDGRAVVAFAMNYDQHGAPTWLLASASAGRSADWGTKFHAYRAGAASPVHASAYSINFYRGPYTPPCALVDQSNLFPRALWKSPGTETLGDCVTPTLLSSGGPAAGVWTGPNGGWAVSIQSDGETLHVHLYGFDEQGNPRWLDGTGELDDDGVADIALQRVTGYCNTCATTALTKQAAGTLKLTVANGVLSADIHAMFGAQATWVRTNVSLHRFVSEQQPRRATTATLRANPTKGSAASSGLVVGVAAGRR